MTVGTTEGHSFISAVMAELSRRKVLRTVGAYAVAVFAILQLMDAAVEPLRLPDWLPTLMVITLILGFPVVFMLAWQFDVTSGRNQITPSIQQPRLPVKIDSGEVLVDIEPAA